MVRSATYDLLLADFTTNADRMYLCSQAPTTFEEATETYALGVKAGITVSAAEAGSGTARKVHISAITDGTVSTAGTATHYALVDYGSSALMSVHALNASKALSTGTPWTCAEFDAVIVNEA